MDGRKERVVRGRGGGGKGWVEGSCLKEVFAEDKVADDRPVKPTTEACGEGGRGRGEGVFSRQELVKGVGGVGVALH